MRRRAARQMQTDLSSLSALAQDPCQRHCASAEAQPNQGLPVRHSAAQHEAITSCQLATIWGPSHPRSLQSKMHSPYNMPVIPSSYVSTLIGSQRCFAHRSGPKQKPAEQHLKPVRLVFDNGAHEVMAISEAQRTAARLGKDLLPVAPGAQPPVFKLGHQDAQAAADRRRYKEQRKRELEQRRKMAVKEVRIGADTADHDLAVKLRQAQGFVEKNFRVKLVVRFGRWRQTEGGQRMRDLVERVGAWAAVTAPQTNEKMPRNTIAVYLTPKLVPVAEAVAKEEVQPPLGSPVPPQAVQPRQQQVHG